MAQKNFESRELTDLVVLYGQCNRITTKTVETYKQMFPNRTHPSVFNLQFALRNLREYGQFEKPKYLLHEHLVTTSDKQWRNEKKIIKILEKNPLASNREVARQLGLSVSVVVRVRKEIQLNHENGDNTPPPTISKRDRLSFCKWLNNNYHQNILWTDETLFTDDGLYHIKDELFWNMFNDDGQQMTSHVKHFIVVWSGMIGSTVFGPYFVVDKMNLKKEYVKNMKEMINNMIDDATVSQTKDLYVQLSGAPPKFEKKVTKYLNESFGEQWIGPKGPIKWPDGSPDLNPVEFCLYHAVKQLVYDSLETKLSNTLELRERILEAFDTIKSEGLASNVTEELKKRVKICLKEGGGTFEHLLK